MTRSDLRYAGLHERASISFRRSRAGASCAVVSSRAGTQHAALEFSMPSTRRSHAPRIHFLHRSVRCLRPRLRRLRIAVPARRRGRGDGPMHRAGHGLRRPMPTCLGVSGSRQRAGRCRMPVLCGCLRCVRPGMRQARACALSGMRTSVHPVCRGVSEHGSKRGRDRLNGCPLAGSAARTEAKCDPDSFGDRSVMPRATRSACRSVSSASRSDRLRHG